MCPGQQDSDSLLPYSDGGNHLGFGTLPCNRPSASNKTHCPRRRTKHLSLIFFIFFFSQVYFLSPLNHFAFIIAQASASLHRLSISSHRHPISESQTLPRKTVPGQKKIKKKKNPFATSNPLTDTNSFTCPKGIK